MSYEECAKHEGEEATNGCAKCDAEERERALLNLDNFLARWFGGTGEREDTLLFLWKLESEGFGVVVLDGGERLRAPKEESTPESRKR